RRSKNCGSSRRTCSDQALLLSKRCWRTRMPVILSWRAFRGNSPRAAGVSHTLGAIRDRPLPPDDREATMTVLLIGLILFLGAHSVRIVADDWRSARIAAMGEGAWKGVYSLVSLAGLALIVWGYGLARAAPVELWQPPVWTRHAASLFTLLSFVLI